METHYWVSEEVPPEESAIVHDEPFLDLQNLPGTSSFHERYDEREMTLKLDTETLEVHHVNSVRFETERHSVARHRFEKREPGF
jgi:hypothetical protein